jgi:hypothetical protein
MLQIKEIALRLSSNFAQPVFSCFFFIVFCYHVDLDYSPHRRKTKFAVFAKRAVEEQQDETQTLFAAILSAGHHS